MLSIFQLKWLIVSFKILKKNYDATPFLVRPEVPKTALLVEISQISQNSNDSGETFKIQIQNSNTLFLKHKSTFDEAKIISIVFLLSILFFAIFGGHKAQLKIWLRLTASWHHSSPNSIKIEEFFFFFIRIACPVENIVSSVGWSSFLVTTFGDS